MYITTFGRYILVKSNRKGGRQRNKHGKSAPCATTTEAMHPPTHATALPDRDEPRAKPRA